MANIGHFMVNWSKHPLFVFLQEPATTTKGRLESLPRGTLVFASSVRPRAAILASADMTAWALPDHTLPDVAACLWKTPNPSLPHIVLASVYCDINTAVIPPELIALIDYCNSSNLPFIIGADSNSWSTLWGCPQNNSRGDEFEDFLATNDIAVLNQHSWPSLGGVVG